MIKKDKAITLISLVVTIVILLILAGIAIATLTGENGLFVRAKQAQQNYSISSAKEKIELAISDLMVEQTSKGENLRKEDLLKINSDDIDVRNTDNFPIEAICQSYKFNINENFTVTYVGEANETIITYTTEPEGYTNKDEVKVLVKISNPKGIKSIQKPGETDKILPQGQTEVGIDFTVTKNGHYELKVEDTNEKQTIKDIYIYSIDKLPPKDFTISIGNIKTTSINIKIEVEDSNETAENAKSGMERYEYYIKESSDIEYIKYESTEKEYTYKNLSKSTSYNIYIIAFDKAGNKKQTEKKVISTKSNNSIGKLLLTTSGFINSYEEDEQGKMIGTLDKTISYLPPDFQGRWGYKTVSWGITTYYDNLYNAFDKDITTSAGFARTGNDGSNDILEMGGYVFVEKDCIGKFLNIYNSTEAIKFIFRDINFGTISSNLINTSSKKNNIVSIIIPENTEYIEMYYPGSLMGGYRAMVSEIFLTNTEVQEDQEINELFH